MTIIERARELRKVIEQAAESLDNKTAYGAPELFKSGGKASFWDGSLVKSGTRIQWNGALMMATVDLWATSENDPDNAPGLWEKIEYRDGYRVLSGPISAVNPVQAGEACWENDVLWKNVSGFETTYRPSEYGYYWERVASE